MKHRDISLTIGLCVSLCAHAALLLGMIQSQLLLLRQQDREFRRPDTAPRLNRLQSQELTRREDPPVPREPEAEERPIFIQAIPAAQAVPPPPEEEIYDRQFGQADGKGKAFNSVEGEQPQRGPKASQEQAFLSRDPVGKGKVGSEPHLDHDSVKVESQVASVSAPPAPPPQLVSLPPPPAPPRVGLPSQPPNAPVPRIKSSTDLAALAANQAVGLRPDPAPPSALQLGQPSLPTSAAPPSSPPVESRHSGTSAADPAPMSDSESDPFAVAGSVEFHAGKVEARLGRKVKTTRPRLTLAGVYDLLALGGRASVILKVKIDPSGTVTTVSLLRSSGSNNLDQPCLVAVYEWWFEPRKDKDGKAIADVFPFSIGIQ